MENVAYSPGSSLVCNTGAKGARGSRLISVDAIARGVGPALSSSCAIGRRERVVSTASLTSMLRTRTTTSYLKCSFPGHRSP